MDPKLKALATEYEKARKQNLQLRQALQAEKDKNKALVDKLENAVENSGEKSDVGEKSQIARLQAELDQMSKSQTTALRERDDKIGRLEANIGRLKAEVPDKVQTADIAVQKDEAPVTEIDKEAVYNAAVDNLKQEIATLKNEHHKELEALMNRKVIKQPDITMPKELTIIDDSELGVCDKDQSVTENEQLASMGTFFRAQIQGYIVRLQNEIARAQYSSAEAQAAMVRLRKADDERFGLIDELRDSREETRAVQAELETIKRSYEEQLNTMTEELAHQLNAAGLNNSSNVVEEEKPKSKSRFNLFGRGNS